MQLPAVTSIRITMKIFKSKRMLIRRMIFLKIHVFSRPLQASIWIQTPIVVLLTQHTPISYRNSIYQFLREIFLNGKHFGIVTIQGCFPFNRHRRICRCCLRPWLLERASLASDCGNAIYCCRIGNNMASSYQILQNQYFQNYNLSYYIEIH